MLVALDSFTVALCVQSDAEGCSQSNLKDVNFFPPSQLSLGVGSLTPS